jgi:hypothetical protein
MADAKSGFRSGSKSERIRFAWGPSSLGEILVGRHRVEAAGMNGIISRLSAPLPFFPPTPTGGAPRGASFEARASAS